MSSTNIKNHNMLQLCEAEFNESQDQVLTNFSPKENVQQSLSPRVRSPNDHNLVEVKIGPKHFDLIKLIGEGAFGKVILVSNKITGELQAMKVISKKLLKKKNNIQYMRSERDILSKMIHPFIVSLHHAFQTETKLFLVMDFLAGGELFFHLKRRGLILEQEIRIYAGEIILALEFLHDLNIIHRDLKPENILLRADGHIALTDFGLAKDTGNNHQDMTKTFCGTSEYMAPEMLSRNGYSKGVDWWALGALIYEMLTGKPPFQAKTEKEIFKKILTEKFSSPSYLTSEAHSLLKGLLEKDVTKRLGSSKSTMFNIGGITALKQHIFFIGLDWNALLRCEIKPPIDLGLTSKKPYNSSNVNNNSGGNNNIQGLKNGNVLMNKLSSNSNSQPTTTTTTTTMPPLDNQIPQTHDVNIEHNYDIENTVVCTYDYDGFTEAPTDNILGNTDNTTTTILNETTLRHNNSITTTAASATNNHKVNGSYANSTANSSVRATNNDDTIYTEENDTNMTNYDDWTKHFHEGFTTQSLSLSILEDNNSLISSPNYSHINSDSEGDNDDNNKDDNALYAGFEYSDKPIKCSIEKMKQLEEEFMLKAMKIQKKKQLKIKKKSEKQYKITIEKEEKKKKVIEEQEKKFKKKEEEKRRLIELEEKRVYNMKIQEIEKYEKLLLIYEEEMKVYNEILEKIKKQIKGYQKKLKDIQLIEDKYDINTDNMMMTSATPKWPTNLTKEQIEKLLTKSELQNKLQIVEKELEEYTCISKVTTANSTNLNTNTTSSTTNAPSKKASSLSSASVPVSTASMNANTKKNATTSSSSSSSSSTKKTTPATTTTTTNTSIATTTTTSMTPMSRIPIKPEPLSAELEQLRLELLMKKTQISSSLDSPITITTAATATATAHIASNSNNITETKTHNAIDVLHITKIPPPPTTTTKTSANIASTTVKPSSISSSTPSSSSLSSSSSSVWNKLPPPLPTTTTSATTTTATQPPQPPSLPKPPITSSSTTTTTPTTSTTSNNKDKVITKSATLASTLTSTNVTVSDEWVPIATTKKKKK